MAFTLLAILILEGFITISIEIMTMRQLTPFYGNSVVITSIIIGFFLLFLAIGYYRGGLYQSDFLKRLIRNYCLSLVWLGVGLSYIFVALFYDYIAFQLAWPNLLCLTLYLILVLAPMIYWLGQTIPITTNLFNTSKGIAAISGHAFFLSTAGSFLGALVTSLILFQFLGVAWSIVINCFLLSFLVLIINRHGTLHVGVYLFLGISVFLIKVLNVDFEKSYFKSTNNYANYRVTNVPAIGRILQINASQSSLITPDNNGFPYIEIIRAILFEKLNMKNKDLLIIGAGGFSLTANGVHDNHFTYVDIDPSIKGISEKYFLQKNVQGDFKGEDARSFLNQSHNVYDVIISDAYSNGNAIPPALLTREYFNQLANHLKPSGFVILNLIASPWFEDNYSKRVNSTIHEVFPNCSRMPLQWDTKTCNILYFCTNGSRDSSKYTDDLNSATLDFFMR